MMILKAIGMITRYSKVLDRGTVLEDWESQKFLPQGSEWPVFRTFRLIHCSADRWRIFTGFSVALRVF